ncbi:MAG: hypothetical protein RLY14_3347 [Planctomycetota bacterium]|jgi:hypothetical protein
MYSGKFQHSIPLRRDFLSQSATALSGIALAQLLGRDGLLAAEAGKQPIRPTIESANPNRARKPHFEAKAKQVLMIFCAGACSHLDTFDYKPELIARHDQPMPGADQLITFQGGQGTLQKSPWQFRPRGESGKMISDLVGKVGELADDICFIHSMTGKTNTHGPGENFMNTGFTLDGFPSVGAWTSYALGSENDSLPAYVAIPDPRGKPQSSGNCWNPGFLPAAFQGTDFNAASPVRNLAKPNRWSDQTDRATRDFLGNLNRHHLEKYPGDTELAARISSYELAAKMQLSVPEVSDLSSESAEVLREYGADLSGSPVLNTKAGYARNCILARKLLESGVRFVQLFNGAYQVGGEGTSNWDGHKILKDQYSIHGEIFDQPTAALLKDLKQRGLLEHTLVVWCTEFGRMPTFQAGSKGRDHNPAGFTAWLAGAGVKAPFSYGATDEFGYKSVDKVATVYDFHATILHLLGLDHERLSFYHNGIERRLTDVHGHVIREILA